MDVLRKTVQLTDKDTPNATFKFKIFDHPVPVLTISCAENKESNFSQCSVSYGPRL